MSMRFYDYTIVKGEDSKVVNVVVSFLNASYLRIETTVSVLNCLSRWGEEFEILCEGDEIQTYSNLDFLDEPHPDKEEWEAFEAILKKACPKEYLARLLDLAYAYLNPIEYVHAHGDVTKRRLTPSEGDIAFCKERIKEALDVLKSL